ncbi:MAG: S24/S26 family peptidase [Thermoplasmataceae archaeon]
MRLPKISNKSIIRNHYFIVFLFMIIIFLSITVYSGEWPPLSVVESSSMEHSAYWTPGVINTGDMVFIKKINSVGNVVTYVQGRESGYSTYGEYGNVILYRSPDGSIIIHRAMMYINWISGKLSVQGFKNQSWIIINGNCIVIDNVGFSHRNFSVNVSKYVGHSGFITMGDNNLASNSPFIVHVAKYNSYAASDQTIFNYPPVNISNVVGVAFGQLPWLGLIKLNILGLEHKWPQSSDVAKNSYIYLSLTIIAIFVITLAPYDRVIKSFKDSRRKS